jgi:hypothetical protein
MLYASEGLISACGLVPSVFGRNPRIEWNREKSRILEVSSKETDKELLFKIDFGKSVNDH